MKDNHVIFPRDARTERECVNDFQPKISDENGILKHYFIQIMSYVNVIVDIRELEYRAYSPFAYP